MNEIEWLLGNGLGSYSFGTMSGFSADLARPFLSLVLRPPLRRQDCVRRLDESVLVRGCWQPLFPSQSKSEHSRAAALVRSSFSFIENIPSYTFQLPGALLKRRVFMLTQEHSLFVQYRLAAGESLALRIAPVFTVPFEIFEEFPQEPFLQCIENGFAFRLESQGGSVLYVSTDAASRVRFVNQWVPAPGDRLDGEASALDFIPAAIELELPQRQIVTLRLGLTPPVAFEASEIFRRAVAFRKHCCRIQLADETGSAYTEVFLNSGDFLIERPTANARHNWTLLSGYPGRADHGWDMLLALPGLLLVTRRFERARDVLRMLRTHAVNNRVPGQFSELPGEPLFDRIDTGFWYIVATYEYWCATGDLQFVEEVFSFLLQLLMTFQQDAIEGVRIDPDDGLVEIAPASPAHTWMDAHIGAWPVTPRTGKAVEIQSLWYNALRIMLEFSQHLQKTNIQEKLARAARVVENHFAAQFWLEGGNYLADVIRDSEIDDSFRANQVLAIGLPFSLLSPQQERELLERIEEQLVTPYGLRTLSPLEPGYRGTVTGAEHERSAAWHNGTVHPWLAWPYVRAALRQKRAHRRLLEQFKPLILSARTHVYGHLYEAFEGDPPHRPLGAPASAISLGAVLQVLAALQNRYW